MEFEEKIDLQSRLDILADAQKLIFFEKNWSKNCTATNHGGQQCPPWDLHAYAWSIYGALEKVLADRNQVAMLLDIVSELQKSTDDPIISFDYYHSHAEVIQLFYFTMGDMAEKLGYNMYTPAFEFGVDANDDYPVMFIPKEFDEEYDRVQEELERRRKEVYEEEMRLSYFDRDND